MTSDLRDRLQSTLGSAYDVGRELGGGGMSRVFVAEEIRLGRRVVVKVLPPELAADVSGERFLREIRLAASLQHPHIIPVLSAGDLVGVSREAAPSESDLGGYLLYYTMPLVDGESLRARLEREGALPVDEAIRLAREVADALGYAHAHGVVHRDIKPDNVLLSGGHAVVADFGVAKAVAGAALERGSITTVGMALGTPAYMAPEQAAGEPRVDHRTDLYAFGAMLYEMLAGRPPFAGRSARQLIAAQVAEMPEPVAKLRPAVPDALAVLVMRCLEKHPADRPASADEVARELARCSASDLVATRRGVGLVATNDVAARRQTGRKIAAGAAGALAIATVTVIAVRGSDRLNVAPSAASIAVLPFAPTSPDTMLARLGRDLVVTLSANLDGVDDIRTVDALTVLAQAPASTGPLSLPDAIALARKLGARAAVYGTVIRVGPMVRLDAGLFSADSAAAMARASVVASPADMAAFTDSATWSLLRQVWRTRTPPTPSIAAITTRSVPALRAFVEGERAAAAYRWPDAARAFGRAIEADSAFWLAYWRFAWAHSWYGEPVDTSVRSAYLRHRSALPERERLLIEASLPESLSVRLRRLRGLTDRFPDYWPGWFAYADRLTHDGPYVGHTAADAQAALERTAALNPSLLGAWQHLAWVTVGRDSATAARAMADLTHHGYRARAIDELGWDELQAFELINHSSHSPSDSAVLIESIARHLASGRTPRGVRYYPPLFLAWRGSPAAQIEINRKAIRLGMPREVADLYERAIAVTWAARGAWDSALVAQDRYGSGADDDIQLHRYRLAAVGAWSGAVNPAVAGQRRAGVAHILTGLPPEDRAEVAWIDGLMALITRDDAGLAAARRAVSASAAATGAILDRSLAAFERDLSGDRRTAGRMLESLEWERAERAAGYDRHPYLIAVNRLAAARWLGAEGDPAAGARLLTWPEAFSNRALAFEAAVLFGALTQLERARLEQMQGRREAAGLHYRQFLRRYDTPVASHQHYVREAEAAALRR